MIKKIIDWIRFQFTGGFQPTVITMHYIPAPPGEPLDGQIDLVSFEDDGFVVGFVDADGREVTTKLLYDDPEAAENGGVYIIRVE